MASNNRNLSLACFDGNLEGIRHLISSGEDVNKAYPAYGRFGHEILPLSAASYVGGHEVVQLLLSSGAQASIGNPLYYATLSRNWDLNIVKLLVEAGANVNEGYDTNATPLLCAAGKDGGHELVEFLLHSGANVNAGYSIGETPLSRASERGLSQTAEVLLSFEADVNAPVGDGKGGNRGTALTVASSSGHVEVVKLLLANGANVDFTTSQKLETPLHKASINGHILVVDQLVASGANLESRDNRGRTPLYFALMLDHFNTAVRLLSHGADLLATDSTKRTALGLALLSSPPQEEWLELISFSSNSETTKTTGLVPLHVAASEGHQELFLWLLSSGEDVTQPDKNGNTPLHFAAENRHKDIVKIILDLGVDANARDKDGTTPLHHAASTDFHKAVDIAKMLLSSGADANAIDNRGETALHVASIRGVLSTVNALLSSGANANSTSLKGWTPLQDASLEEHLSVMERLCEAGADLNAVENTDGQTALHVSIELGNWRGATLLLELGADALVVDNSGKTPLSCLISSGQYTHDINLVYALVHGFVSRGFFDGVSADNPG